LVPALRMLWRSNGCAGQKAPELRALRGESGWFSDLRAESSAHLDLNQCGAEKKFRLCSTIADQRLVLHIDLALYRVAGRRGTMPSTSF
jgi:hypothetical protein